MTSLTYVLAIATRRVPNFKVGDLFVPNLVRPQFCSSPVYHLVWFAQSYVFYVVVYIGCCLSLVVFLCMGFFFLQWRQFDFDLWGWFTFDVFRLSSGVFYCFSISYVFCCVKAFYRYVFYKKQHPWSII